MDIGTLIGTGIEQVISGEAWNQLVMHWHAVQSMSSKELAISAGYAFYLYAAYHAA